MKEVKIGCVAGPFAVIPFDHYVQSPIGLVPKDSGRQTRLIFHLSYDFKTGKSVNHFIPRKKCSVHYYDLDHAVKCFLMFMKKYGVNTSLWFGKSDGRSTFRVLPLLKSCWFLLTMKARDPRTGKWQFFIDKCLPFGARISCTLFQMVSDALRHLLEFKVSPCLPDARHSINNYLNDFLFIVRTLLICNWLIQQFLDLCSQVGIPIAMEKTEWATQLVMFLGILLNGIHFTLSVPEEKRVKAVELLQIFRQKRSTTVKELQALCGYLNFLCRAVHPG